MELWSFIADTVSMYTRDIIEGGLVVEGVQCVGDIGIVLQHPLYYYTTIGSLPRYLDWRRSTFTHGSLQEITGGVLEASAVVSA